MDLNLYFIYKTYLAFLALLKFHMRDMMASQNFLKFNGDDSVYVQQEIGYWLGRRGNNGLIPFVESKINPKAFLRDIEYIEFDPLNPNIGFTNVTSYIKRQIKMRRNQLIFDVGVSLGIVGFISLVLYGLSKLDDE